MDTTKKEYTPISCATYDDIIRYVTHKAPVTMTLETDGSTETKDVLVTDVYTKESVEYMTTGEGNTYRLDQIRSIQGDTVS